MFQAIVDFLTEIIKSLLPEKNSTNGVWISRILILIFASYGALIFLYFGLQDTSLGQKLGISILTPKTAVLRHIDFIDYTRRLWQQLAAVRNANDSIKGAFIVGLYNEETGNFIRDKEEYGKVRVKFITHSLLLSRYDALEVVEDGLDMVVKRSFGEMVKKQDCIGGTISPNLLNFFKKGIEDFQSTHASACPIQVYRKNEFFIPAILMFFYLPKNDVDRANIEYELRRVSYVMRNSIWYDKPRTFYFGE